MHMHTEYADWLFSGDIWYCPPGSLVQGRGQRGATCTGAASAGGEKATFDWAATDPSENHMVTGDSSWGEAPLWGWQAVMSAAALSDYNYPSTIVSLVTGMRRPFVNVYSNPICRWRHEALSSEGTCSQSCGKSEPGFIPGGADFVSLVFCFCGQGFGIGMHESIPGDQKQSHAVPNYLVRKSR
jgi:hypothetical protein